MSWHLEREIENIKKDVLVLGAEVEKQLTQSVQAFVDLDSKLAQEVIDVDDNIDEMEVDVEEDCLKVIDLGSANGTYLNGEKIQEGLAQPGDELRFDQHCFIVVGPVTAAADAQPGAAEQTVIRGSEVDATMIGSATVLEGAPGHEPQVEDEQGEGLLISLAANDRLVRLEPYTGGPRAYHRRYALPSLLLCPAVLHAVGLAESAEGLRLELVLPGGEARELALGVDRETRPEGVRPWRLLCPDPIAGESQWTSVLSGVDELPLYLLEPEELFRYEPVAGGEFAYVQLRANIGLGGRSIREFGSEVLQHLEQLVLLGSVRGLEGPREAAAGDE